MYSSTQIPRLGSAPSSHLQDPASGGGRGVLSRDLEPAAVEGRVLARAVRGRYRPRRTAPPGGDGTRRPPLAPPFDIGWGRSGRTPGAAGAPGMSEFRGGVRGHGGELPLWPPPGDRERGLDLRWDAPRPGRPEGREGAGHPLPPPQTRGPGRVRDPSRVSARAGVTIGAGVAPQRRGGALFWGQEATLPAVTPPRRRCHTGRGHPGICHAGSAAVTPPRCFCHAGTFVPT